MKSADFRALYRQQLQANRELETMNQQLHQDNQRLRAKLFKLFETQEQPSSQSLSLWRQLIRNWWPHG